MAEQDVQYKTFRQEPVKVKIGDGDKMRVITIADIPHKKHQELLREIGNILLSRDAIPVALSNIERSIQAQMVRQNKTAEDAIKTFIEKVADMYANLSGPQVIKLLNLATDGQITEADEDILGADECLEFLGWLLQHRFKSLKNLYASLDATLSETTKGIQK